MPWPLFTRGKDPVPIVQEAGWAPFQTHYYSENLVAPGIEPETSASVARNSDH